MNSKIDKKEKLLIDLFKSLRIQNNMTQKELAKSLKLKTHSSYNHKENKRSVFTLGEFIKLVEIFDIDCELTYEFKDEFGKIVTKKLKL